MLLLYAISALPAVAMMQKWRKRLFAWGVATVMPPLSGRLWLMLRFVPLRLAGTCAGEPAEIYFRQTPRRPLLANAAIC